MESIDNRKVETMELGRRISEAIRRMMGASRIDEKVVDLCLKEISLALFQTDLQFKLVRNLQDNVKNRINQYERKIILHSIFDELCKILDPGKPNFSRIVKKQRNIVVFAGLQGSGKTTACTQFANYYKKQGFRAAIVSADTFRASNFDQLIQNTTAATIPLYGSFMQSDPVPKNALGGINWFRKHAENLKPFDLVIIDTSERHTQLSSLIEETRQVSEATKPDLVIFVVDSGSGLAAFHQVKSFFNQTVKTGAVIMSRATHDQKGGEAVSAIAATRTPVMFVGRGEGLDEFEAFDIKPFVNRLLGLGEMLGFKDDVPGDAQQPEFLTNYTLRIYHMIIHNSNEQLAKKKGHLWKLGILRSLTAEELDGRLENLLSCQFILRIAKRSLTSVRAVLFLIEDLKTKVALFKLLDRNSSNPPCEYFEKVIPGVIISKRKKPTSEKSNESFKAKLQRILVGKQTLEEEEEDEIAKLRAVYGRGKPLPATNYYYNGRTSSFGGTTFLSKERTFV